MPLYALNEDLIFPPPHLAEPDGLLAIYGDLSPRRLLLAYSMGIFPWFSDDEPILWWSPDPRCVLYPKDLRVTKSMRQVLRSKKFTVTFDTAFSEVIGNCQQAPRKDQSGTWITEEMRDAYKELHRLGFAHSVEVWNQDKELVGGLYGVAIGKCFFGESMFAKASNASKMGFITLTRQLETWGFQLIDCQVHTTHLESLGALMISRQSFTRRLAQLIHYPNREGAWQLEIPPPRQ